MKKKFFLVGALVAMSMSAMFVACSKDEKQENELKGCTCEYYIPEMGATETSYFPLSEMKSQYGANTCAELTQAIVADSYGFSSSEYSVRCHE